MKKIINRVGENFKTNQGYTVEIIEYTNYQQCIIKFNDEFNTILKARYHELKLGEIKNPNHRNLCKVGYMGQGIYTYNDMVYTKWANMIRRCYSEKPSKNDRTYIDCYVNKDWHNYQNFAEWFYKNYKPEIMQGWHLDKDILVQGNKEYSAENCCFVPNEINSIFRTKNSFNLNSLKGAQSKDSKFQTSIKKKGIKKYLGIFETPEEAHQVYMKAKKEYLVEVSEKWRGILSDKVCEAIKNYDITLL